jgi:hypothetical protein
MTEGRRQKAENGTRKSEDGKRNWDDGKWKIVLVQADDAALGGIFPVVQNDGSQAALTCPKRYGILHGRQACL